jgi:cell division control protein 45
MRYQLHTLILLNIGSILDLPSSEWFGDFPPRVHVHVIDSGRPQNLSSLFGGGEGSERVIIWDDGGAERLDEERKAWETLNVSVLWPAQPALRALIVFLLKNEPEPDSDASSDDDLSEDLPENSEEEGVQSPSRKRRSLSDGSRTPSKRKRLDIDVRAAALSSIYKFLWWFQRPPRASREQRDGYFALLDKYYMSGTWYGQSAAGIVYILATVLERVDNDLLWYVQIILSIFSRCSLTKGSQSLVLSISIPVVEYHVLSTRNSIPFIMTRFPVSTLSRPRTMSTA